MKVLSFVSLLCLSLISISSGPEKELNKEVSVNGRTYLYGEINRDGLKSKQYKNWFNPLYDRYQPNAEKMALCGEKALEGLTVKLLMATWCGDSKRNVPAFFKVMDGLGFDDKNLQMWALDTRKHGPENEQQRFGVTRVPTIIFYRDDVEIGRFVERPRPGQKLEDIIVSIINQP